MLRALFLSGLCSQLCLLLWSNTSPIAWIQKQTPFEPPELERLLIHCCKTVMIIDRKMTTNYSKLPPYVSCANIISFFLPIIPLLAPFIQNNPNTHYTRITVIIAKLLRMQMFMFSNNYTKLISIDLIYRWNLLCPNL